VISAFLPDSCLGEPDALHSDEPFDGVQILKVFPQIEEDQNNDGVMALAHDFVNQWADDHPDHKLLIDTYSVTL
jgi:hypothetical protein